MNILDQNTTAGKVVRCVELGVEFGTFLGVGSIKHDTRKLVSKSEVIEASAESTRRTVEKIKSDAAVISAKLDKLAALQAVTAPQATPAPQAEAPTQAAAPTAQQQAPQTPAAVQTNISFTPEVLKAISDAVAQAAVPTQPAAPASAAAPTQGAAEKAAPKGK